MGLVSAVIAIAVCFFTLGVLHARRLDALDRSTYDKQFDALRVELQSAIALGESDNDPATANEARRLMK